MSNNPDEKLAAGLVKAVEQYYHELEPRTAVRVSLPGVPPAESSLAVLANQNLLGSPITQKFSTGDKEVLVTIYQPKVIPPAISDHQAISWGYNRWGILALFPFFGRWARRSAVRTHVSLLEAGEKHRLEAESRGAQEASDALKQPTIRELLCRGLRSVRQDAGSVLDAIIKILLPAGVISQSGIVGANLKIGAFQLSAAAIATLALIIARGGIAVFCPEAAKV